MNASSKQNVENIINNTHTHLEVHNSTAQKTILNFDIIGMNDKVKIVINKN